MCVPVGIVNDLAAAGHDVVHVRSLDPRASDKWIVDEARTGGRIVVTMDLDFGDIMSHIQRARAAPADQHRIAPLHLDGGEGRADGSRRAASGAATMKMATLRRFPGENPKMA
jgi:hypothetical protein